MTALSNSTAQFLRSEDGAVTVDWVVLTAALVGLGLAAMAVVSGGTEDLSSDVDAQLVSQEITSEFDSGPTAYDGAWLAPGAYESDAAWVAQLSDASIEGLLTGYAQFANPDNVDLGNHAEPRYHDQYWMAYNQAVERGLEIPDNPNL